MLEIMKFGSNDYGVWVIGHLKYTGLEVTDIFNTNLKDTSFLQDKESVKVKNVKISRDRKRNILFKLEF